MTGYVLASLIFLGGIITATLGELVNEEIRGWLDYLPRFILRLAAARLDPAGKITIYEDEWLPELACILRGAEARPISRLIIGVKFSAGLLITAKRIARHLHRTPPSPARSDLPQPATASAAAIASASVKLQLLTDTLANAEIDRDVIAAQMSSARDALDCAELAAREAAESSQGIEVIKANHLLHTARAQVDNLGRLSVENERDLAALFFLRACQKEDQVELLGNG